MGHSFDIMTFLIVYLNLTGLFFGFKTFGVRKPHISPCILNCP